MLAIGVLSYIFSPHGSASEGAGSVKQDPLPQLVSLEPVGAARCQDRISNQLLRDWACELLDPEVCQGCRLCFDILVYGVLSIGCLQLLSRCRLKLQLRASTLLDDDVL